MATPDPDFLGLPDDLARLGLQRLMTCDLRWRSHERAARSWQRIAAILGIVAAISASLAAVSVVQGIEPLAISLSIMVAVVVPLHSALGASGRFENSREAAVKFELLAHEYERYIQLDLGPAWWRGEITNLDRQRTRIDALDERLALISSTAPRVSFKDAQINETEIRAEYLVKYMQMENVSVPNKEVWVH